MWEGLLPIGSIVKLKEAKRLIMIMGVWQTSVEDEDETISYDYSGVTYPEGYINRDVTLVFNREDIVDVLYIGYMDDEQQFLMERIEPLVNGIRSGELTFDEAVEMAQNMINDLRKERE